MRWGLFTVRLAMAITSLLIALLLILTFVPLMMGGLDIEFPEEGDVAWEMDGNIYSAVVPVRFHNGGYFDIEDFSIAVDIQDAYCNNISSSSTEKVDLAAGIWTVVRMPVTIDLDQMSDQARTDLVLNGSTYKAFLTIDTWFGLRTIHTTIDTKGGSEISIPALISNLEIQSDNYDLNELPDGYQISIPYSFQASDLIVGSDLQISSEMSNATQVLSQMTEGTALQSYNSGSLDFNISEDAAQHLFTSSDALTFNTDITLLGFTYHRVDVVDWVPPLQNLAFTHTVVSPNMGGADVELWYSFDATFPVVGQSVYMQLTVSDHTGVIATSTDQYMIYGHTERPFKFHVDAITFAHLYGNPETWDLELHVYLSDYDFIITDQYAWDGGA